MSESHVCVCVSTVCLASVYVWFRYVFAGNIYPNIKIVR